MAKPTSPTTSEEYLRQERARPIERAELVEGMLVAAKGGAGRRHAVLVSALDVALNTRLVGTPCQAVVSEMRVKAEDTETYAYPDVVVFCEEEYEDDEQDTLLTPMVIFEVLSPATQGYDRGDKFSHYRTIASLRHYVLVSSDRRFLDHYARRGRDAWLLTPHSQPTDVLRLDPPGVELTLDEIYARTGL